MQQAGFAINSGKNSLLQYSVNRKCTHTYVEDFDQQVFTFLCTQKKKK
jgi:hypothetical protein